MLLKVGVKKASLIKVVVVWLWGNELSNYKVPRPFQWAVTNVYLRGETFDCSNHHMVVIVTLASR